jgi:protein-disulfide isomerase
MRVPTESDVADAPAADPDGDSATGQAAANDTPLEKVTGKSIEEPPAAAAPRRERKVSFLGGKLTLNVYDHPVIGDPEAPHIIVEMVSYDCPHCRKMHRIVQKGLRRYGNQLAVLIMTVPLEWKCNRLITDPKASHPGACTTSRMAVAVANLNPAAFAKFHDWLMADEEKPPAQAKIVAKAFEMVDREQLRELSQGGTLNEQISKYIDLVATLQTMKSSGKKVGGLPIQILGDEVMSGMAESADDVYRAWEQNLGIKPL